jgi:tetratricopeptide (TPR) repeat protein
LPSADGGVRRLRGTSVVVGVAEAFEQASRQRAAGRLDDAEQTCRQILAAHGDSAAGLYLLGLIASDRGRTDEASNYLARALEHGPDSADFFYDIGLAYQRLGRFAEAIVNHRKALKLRPDFAEAHANLGAASALAGRIDDAVTALRAALRLKADDPTARCHLGAALSLQGKMDEALENLGEALRLQPDHAEAHQNMAEVMMHVGRLEEAVDHFEAALAICPGWARVHYNLAMALLRLGRYAAGWRQAEWRWKIPDINVPRRGFGQLRWYGQDISGRVLLLHPEQGFGDMLQFFRYGPLAAARCARVYLETPPPLLRLFRASLVRDNLQIIEPAADFPGTRGLPRFDYHCPVLGLPLAFGTTLADIPADVPYLRAEPAELEAWRRRLQDIPRPLVGLAWAGSAKHARDRLRSIRLDRLAPLFDVGATFVSLQKGEAAAQAAAPPFGMALHDFSAELADFADTAALVMALDLVISVDTAVAHLAGALAKPVWLLDRFDADWRWLLDRDDSPWYPTMRIFRQPRLGDWDGVVHAVRGALARLAAGHMGEAVATRVARGPNHTAM